MISRLEISWIRSTNSLRQQRLASPCYREVNVTARLFPTMIEHKEFTTPSQYRGKGAGGVTNQSSTQSIDSVSDNHIDKDGQQSL